MLQQLVRFTIRRLTIATKPTNNNQHDYAPTNIKIDLISYMQRTKQNRKIQMKLMMGYRSISSITS